MPRTPPLAARLALTAIRGYQRWISPHKGFCCALRSATGGASCSAYGYQVIARFGLGRGLGLLRRRFELCGHVHRHTAAAVRPAPKMAHPRRRRERGYCDPGCDAPGCDLPCDGSHGHSRIGCCDFLNCGCDLADTWRSKRARQARSRCWPFVRQRQRNTEQLDALARRIRERRTGRR